MADNKTRDSHRSLQSNIKNNNKDLTKYSLFLGGLNVKAKALEQGLINPDTGEIL